MSKDVNAISLDRHKSREPKNSAHSCICGNKLTTPCSHPSPDRSYLGSIPAGNNSADNIVARADNNTDTVAGNIDAESTRGALACSSPTGNSSLGCNRHAGLHSTLGRKAAGSLG